MFIQIRCLVFVITSIFISSVLGGSVIILNTTGQPPLNSPDTNGFMDQVATEAFKRIGVTLKTVVLPAERGLYNANNGQLGGEMSRIAGLQKKYRNLIQVPEPIMNWQFIAFSRNKTALNGWSGLKGKYVAFINGWKIVERNVPAGSYVVKVKSPQLLFGLIKYKRVDYIVYERWGGLRMKAKMGLTKVEPILPALATRKMYIYLNKRHAKLVPALVKALVEIKQDGTYQKIYNRTLKPYLVQQNK